MNYNVVCLTETWLHENIESSELLLNDYEVYRSDRPSNEGISNHGGVLIAVKKTLSSMQVLADFPNCCVCAKLSFNNQAIFLVCFYNPPKLSPYRYSAEDFTKITNFIKSVNDTVVLCGDINFPGTNWNTYLSVDPEESNVLEALLSTDLQQNVDFPTCGSNVLDVVLHRNSQVTTLKDDKIEQIYDCTDHSAICIKIDCPATRAVKAPRDHFLSYGSADFGDLRRKMIEIPFKPVCFTNVNNLCGELYEYFDLILTNSVPRRSRHRQSLPPWISPETSNLMKRLSTKKSQLARKPTSYRRNQVLRLENIVIEQAELERSEYQQKLLSSRNPQIMYKHFKSLNRGASLPPQMTHKEIAVDQALGKAQLLNEFFQSVYAPKVPFSIEDIDCKDPTLIDFRVSRGLIHTLMLQLDDTKSRGPNGYPPILYRRLAKEMSISLNVIFKTIKRLRKIPRLWKIAAVSPIHKKGDRKMVSNYRPISLLNIDSKILERAMYEPLYHHFTEFLCKNQHGFVKKRSVLTNMLSFLKQIYKAMDQNAEEDVIAVYTDFSKAFDKVPHKELITKVAGMGVGGCYLEVLIDYLHERKQFVRVDNVESTVLDVTSGVPQGSLLGPLLFCIFINDLPDVLFFSEPFLYADDLKLLSIGKSREEIAIDLTALQKWIEKNHMQLAEDKCYQLNFRGRINKLSIGEIELQNKTVLKDLGLLIDCNLNWSTHIEDRIKKCNKVFFYVKRNMSHRLPPKIKLAVYKSMLLPILAFGSECYPLSRTNLQKFETIQRRIVGWIDWRQEYSYHQKLKLLKLLPLPMFFQLKSLLQFSTVLQNSRYSDTNDTHYLQVETSRAASRNNAICILSKPRTEKLKGEFTHRVGRLANSVHKYVNMENQHGLKTRILDLMWNFMDKKYSESNPCTWQLLCGCPSCRDVWTLF